MYTFHLIKVEEKEDVKMKFHFIESLFEVYKEKEEEEEIALIEPNIPQNIQTNRRRGREEHPPREEQKKKTRTIERSSPQDRTIYKQHKRDRDRLGKRPPFNRRRRFQLS